MHAPLCNDRAIGFYKVINDLTEATYERAFLLCLTSSVPRSGTYRSVFGTEF